jgi:hypothetical protein
MLFSETLERWRNFRFVPKPPPPVSGSRALFVLARAMDQVRWFIRNSRSLFDGGYFDDVFIFNEESYNGPSRIENVMVRLIDVKQLWGNFPSGFNPREHRTTWRVVHSRDPDWGYQHMCRFFWMSLFDLPELANVRFYMRLDLDSCLGPTGGSPFRFLGNDTVYVRGDTGYDSADVTRGLRAVTLEYVRYFGIFPKDEGRWEMAFRGKDVAIYGTNFEVMDLLFWRRPEVQQFVMFIDLSWGIFLSRWGDAPLRYLALTLFARPEQVVPRPAQWRYNHPCLTEDE